MRKLFLIIQILLITISVKAQLWCTPNSVWHFDNSNPLWDTKYTKQTYLYDTLVGTTIFNKIKNETHGYNINGQINNYSYFYTSLQNNVVFFNSTNTNISDSDTLIYFGPIGSKWRCWKNGGTSCAQSFIEIVDAGTSTIQGQNLIWRKINYTNYYMFGTTNQSTQTGTDTIFERIGYKHLAFQFLGYCSDVPDAVPSSFRCFQDNQININSTNKVCDFTTGIFENTHHFNSISIYPNPTISILNIIDKQNQFQNATIQIKNYLGQVIFTTPFTSQINLQNLSAGMYFLTVKDKDYLKTVKIIKE
ncbi:MAG: T9SS type A sorting domain-containing protein [Bacteroidia bacterium]|nr:T9SS type A sorting domain-containing protein [Bacteroidia bacterium]